MTLNSASKRVLLIAGPTASGKSSVAASLATQLDGVIINADALQMYAELQVLSARPSAEELQRLPHLMYGTVPARERYSVGRWLEDVAAVLASVWEEGQLPIVVGGTGLYFKALEEGLAPVPEIPDEVRSLVAGWYADEGIAGLQQRLAGDGAKPADQHRLIRALEVQEATGQSLKQWQDANTTSLIGDAAVSRGFLMPERAAVYARCEERFDMMLTTGALEEVQALLAQNLDPDLPAMKAIGVNELSRYLAGEMTLEDASALAKMQTRRYVKRQFTWYRSQMPGWPAILPEEASKVLLEEIVQ